jgi:hypothetical protein
MRGPTILPIPSVFKDAVWMAKSSEMWCWTLDVALERWCRIHHASGDVRRDETREPET